MIAPPFADRPVLVLYTGGTLGMMPSAEGLVPAGDIETRLRNALDGLPPSRQSQLPEFVVHTVASPIDSSDSPLSTIRSRSGNSEDGR